MAAENGNIYISGTVTDSVEILSEIFNHDELGKSVTASKRLRQQWSTANC